MKYSRTRAIEQIAAAALKSRKIEIGTELTVSSVIEGELANGQANEVLLCETTKGNIRVPVRELLKMKQADGSNVFSMEEGAAEVELPGKLKIVSSTDRTDRDGDTVYPIYAYKKAEEQLEAGNIDWSALKDGGLKKDHGFDPVQNYVVAVL
jgi:hypothetical protein